MAVPKRTLDVFVIYDGDGDYVVASDRDDAMQAYTDSFDGVGPVRCVFLQLKVPPIVDVEAEIDVPEERAKVIIR